MKSILQDTIERQESIRFTGSNEGWIAKCRPVNAGDVFPADEPRGPKFDECDHFGTEVCLNEDDPESDYLRVLIPEDELDFNSEVAITPWGDSREPISISVDEGALYRFAQLVVAAIDAKRSAHNA